MRTLRSVSLTSLRAMLALSVLLCASPCLAAADAKLPDPAFVRVSPRDARYLELSDGRPYIPIGLNMIAPPGNEGLPGLEAWFKNLSANGGNFIRVWLSNPFFDLESARSGEYDEAKARRIDGMLALAAQHGIRVKMCLEHFRHLGTGKQTWAAKPLHLIEKGGPAQDIADFFDGARSREQFKRKLAWYAQRYGANPTVFGWELWNEINAVAGGDYMAWTEVMLPELRRLFPRHLAMQSLGSFDTERVRPLYRRHSTMAGNDLAQVHRYLDLGASLEICKAPMDLLAAGAVREIQDFAPGRPVLLAESGAVEPRHSGPFKLYDRDVHGLILHDVLFAPFFAGAAGPGHIWHWDSYVARQNLWRHFGHFAEVVKDLDPPAEHFEPLTLPHERLRIAVLKGQSHVLLWCRDRQNTWQTELAEARAPEPVQNVQLDLQALAVGHARARLYDPWQGRWTETAIESGRLKLPEFTRSIVVRIDR